MSRFCWLLCTAGFAAATEPFSYNTLHISNTDGAQISPNFYALFLETEISFGGEGGIYGEMVWNRDFEALGRGILNATALPDRTDASSPPTHPSPLANSTPGLDPHEPPADPTDFRPWYAKGSPALSLSSTDPVYPANPHYLSVLFNTMNDAIVNDGYVGMHLEEGAHYDLTFYAKGDVEIEVQLACGDQIVGRVGFGVNGNDWTKYGAAITAERSCSGGALRVAPKDETALGVLIHLDHISLFPGNAVAGLFRADLYQYLADYAPPLLRIPGGAYLVGTGLRTRFNWENTIPPRQQRAGHFNSVRNYWVTDGFGINELIALMQLLNAKPVFGVYAGGSLFSKFIPLNESLPFVTEALNLIEYCNGNNETIYGRKRSQNGLAPIGLTRIELGNEESITGKEGYQGHYELIASAVWKKYPFMHIVSSGLGSVSPTANRTDQCMPCTGGCGMHAMNCSSWDEHAYQNPDTMVAFASTYDDYSNPFFCHTDANGVCPPVDVMEYATSGSGMLAASADAFFTIGLQRNAHIVGTTMYAPLFNNVRLTTWVRNMINFNASHSFATATYYVQRMLKEALGDMLLETHRAGFEQSTTWNGVASRRGDTAFIKLVNYKNTTTAVDLLFEGFSQVAVNGTAVAMWGSGDGLDENTLEAPRKHVPQYIALEGALGAQMTVSMKPFSVYVIRAEVV